MLKVENVVLLQPFEPQCLIHPLVIYSRYRI